VVVPCRKRARPRPGRRQLNPLQTRKARAARRPPLQPEGLSILLLTPCACVTPAVSQAPLSDQACALQCVGNMRVSSLRASTTLNLCGCAGPVLARQPGQRDHAGHAQEEGPQAGARAAERVRGQALGAPAAVRTQEAGSRAEAAAPTCAKDRLWAARVGARGALCRPARIMWCVRALVVREEA